MGDKLMSRDEFYAAVGASPKRIRQALIDLRLTPLRENIADLRQAQYLAAWVQIVKQQILLNARKKSAQPDDDQDE